jgi:hypothetical protein
MGGGEYERPLRPLAGRPLYLVGPEAGQHHTLTDAIAHWQRDKRDVPDHQRAIIEICDSGVYEEPIEIELAAGDRLELRAAQRRRPVVRLLNWYSNRPDSMKIRGEQLTEDTYPDGLRGTPQLLLDGLLITGRSIRITGMIGRVTIRHCTLVPGWSIGSDCEPDSRGQPSVDFADTVSDLVVEHSIIGPIRVSENSVDTDPIAVMVSDTVLDATDSQYDALCGPDGRHARVLASIARSTVFGRICVAALELGEDSIFTGPVGVTRQQTGCLRFCFVTPDSVTPRRYHCQPDLVVAAVKQRFERGQLSDADVGPATARARLRVRPQFTSQRYGTSGYAQLALACAPEITSGAHDESEMGAFHDLFQPQRAANLRTRLDEHTPAGFDTGIVYVT